jgi:CubicO group peptidase (beta-lactamase class C family)
MGAFTGTGVDRLRRVLAGHVERGGVPGVVALVDRGGETAEVCLGSAEVGGPALARDAIFRISSMTKPITAVAALTLVEDCVLRLDEPVVDLLPELADRRVLRTVSSELDDTVPAGRPISVRDLLTFTMGFGQLMVEPSAYPIMAAAYERKVGVGPPDPAGTPEPQEWMRRLGELPLMWQPGERWAYNTSAEVLGVLIARASGRSLGDYLAERVLGPAGMVDTGFSVPAGSLDRLVTLYQPEPGGLAVSDPADGAWSRPPAFESGAAGLVSTAGDLIAFGRLLLSGGGPVLSRRSVEAMTSDQLTPAQREVVDWVPFDGTSWGFGVGLATARTGPAAAPGRFGWDGGLGSSWSCDRTEDLVGVLLTQTRWTSATGPAIAADFWTATYSALT